MPATLTAWKNASSLLPLESHPGLKIADERGKFVFFTGIVIDIQWLDKGFIEFLCQLLTEDFRPEFFPEKTKCRIGNAVVTDTAVFLVVVILPSSNIKNKTS